MHFAPVHVCHKSLPRCPMSWLFLLYQPWLNISHRGWPSLQLIPGPRCELWTVPPDGCVGCSRAWSHPNRHRTPNLHNLMEKAEIDMSGKNNGHLVVPKTDMNFPLYTFMLTLDYRYNLASGAVEPHINTALLKTAQKKISTNPKYTSLPQSVRAAGMLRPGCFFFYLSVFAKSLNLSSKLRQKLLIE